MEEAYQKHRTRLFNAFSRECNQFERDLREELSKRITILYPQCRQDGVEYPKGRDHRLTSNSTIGDANIAKETGSPLEEIRSFRNQDFKADDLGHETRNIELDHGSARQNSRLSSLHHLPQREVDRQSTPSINGIDTLAKLESKASISCQEHEELVAKFDALSRQYSMLAEAHNSLVVKYKRERQTIKAWSEYIERQKQSRRRSRPITSTNPSDDEVARNIFPTGSPTDDTRIPHSGALSLVQPNIPSPPLLRPAVRSPSDSRNGCSPNPIPPRGVSTSGSLTKGICRESVLARSPDPRSETSIKREYSSPDTLLKPPGRRGGGFPSYGLPSPSGSRRQQPARAEIQYPNKTHVDGYNSADTTDGEVERHDAASPPNSIAKRVHCSSKAVPGESASSPTTPVVLSERCLKRKMTSQYGTVTKPIRIKSEHGSSSPIAPAGNRDRYELPESLDLDEVGEKVDTPRKRKRLGHVSLESQCCPNPVLDDSSLSLSKHPFQPLVKTPRKTKGDCLDPRASGQSVQHLAESEGGDKIQRTEEVSHGEGIVPRAAVELNGTDTPQRHLTSQKLEANLLQPSSTNLRLSYHTRGSKPKKSHSRSEEELEKAVANAQRLAEDGENILGDESIFVATEAVGEDVGRTSEERDSRHRRLITLLDVRSSGRSVLSPGKHLSRNVRRGTKKKSLPCDGQPHNDAVFQEDGGLDIRKPHIAASQQSRMQLFSSETKATVREGRKPRNEGSANPNHRHLINSGSRQRSEPLTLEATRDSGRLRDRPLSSLTLEDFKVNPSYKGSDFAFAETVRNQDQRKSLPSCTKPGCCGGTLRKALELGGIPISGPSKIKLFWNSSQEQEDGEQQLIEDYLGNDGHLLHRLTTEERRELVIQARTKQFADKHGKHRQAFERRATPPGFWRTDMPTSQELERDREEARRAVRETVEERYIDARRGKGKWIFRDE